MKMIRARQPTTISFAAITVERPENVDHPLICSRILCYKWKLAESDRFPCKHDLCNSKQQLPQAQQKRYSTNNSHSPECIPLYWAPTVKPEVPNLAWTLSFAKLTQSQKTRAKDGKVRACSVDSLFEKSTIAGLVINARFGPYAFR